MNRLSVHAEIHDGTETRAIVIHGRDAWALCELVKAGAKGCTPIEQPGPRWSGYVHKLRKLGIHVVTIDERHGGPLAGRHARYVLQSTVRIVSTSEQVAA